MSLSAATSTSTLVPLTTVASPPSAWLWWLWPREEEDLLAEEALWLS